MILTNFHKRFGPVRRLPIERKLRGLRGRVFVEGLQYYMNLIHPSQVPHSLCERPLRYTIPAASTSAATAPLPNDCQKTIDALFEGNWVLSAGCMVKDNVVMTAGHEAIG